MVILIKSQQNWVKIVDFSIITYFWTMCQFWVSMLYLLLQNVIHTHSLKSVQEKDYLFLWLTWSLTSTSSFLRNGFCDRKSSDLILVGKSPSVVKKWLGMQFSYGQVSKYVVLVMLLSIFLCFSLTCLSPSRNKGSLPFTQV